MADHLGRHALANFAFGLRHQGQRPVRMGLDVDKAGRDDFTGGVYYVGAARRNSIADIDDASVHDGNICLDSGRAGAVDDMAVPYDDGVGHVFSPVVSRAASALRVFPSR